jgi:hypothetical protein
MKKQSIFTIVFLLTIFVLTSCGKHKAKEVKLGSMNDSLNYTLGLYNGQGIKDYYLKKDSSDNAIAALLNAIDKAYSTETSKDEMYKLGLQIGNSFKMNKKQGLLGDSTLVFDQKLVMQGLINALNKFEEGMKPADADRYLNDYMMKKQAAMMPQQQPQQQAPAEGVSAN